MPTPRRGAVPRAAWLLLLLAGCVDPEDPAKPETEDEPAAEVEAVAHPRLVLSDASLDFGVLAWGATDTRTLVASNAGTAPLGIGGVSIGDDPTSFSVDWDPCDVTCGGVAVAACDASVAALDPGCELPLTVTYAADRSGDARDAVIVGTVTDPSAEPAWHADLLHAYDVVYLHGSTTRVVPSISVTPRVYSFGLVYPGVEVDPARVTVTNLGDADLTLTGASLTDCSPAFTLTSAFEAGQVLAPGATTSVEVAFAPTDVWDAFCLLEVTSDDPLRPVVDVTLSGNTSDVPDTAPTVTIDSPVSPAEHDSSLPLRVELTVTDPDQPLSTLECVIESKVLGAGPLAYCTPDDEGHVIVDIPGGTLPVGIDVLWVNVADAQFLYASAALPLRVDTPAPPGDTDGDGFIAAGDPRDCDDADASVYPSAIEGADGVDDDCDGVTDEGTSRFDDDGDGLTEADGDCEDTRDDDYLGAPERPDGRDNDCDGVVDEGTALVDDDGDGFAEIEYDCDDADATVHPGAAEACDGVDTDCDGVNDDDTCDGEPMGVVGNVIHLEQTALLEGETIWMEVLTQSADGATLTCSWSTTEDGSFDDPAATRVTYTAGSAAGERDPKDLYASVTHPDGRHDLASGMVTVYGEGFDLYGE